MKHLLIIITLMALSSCKETPQERVEGSVIKETPKSEKRDYPDALKKVIKAHGGIENWKAMRTLTFDIPKSQGKETHTVDLHTRKDKIEMSEVTMGFEGSEVWLKDENNKYEGNPAVYHNLMFYFYAMPFVLADPGINYGEAKDLIYEGKSYPGIHISYENGVGASPKDDYYLHFDPETNRMAWLGYTFTFGSDEKSDDLNWIRYNEWTRVQGLLVPKLITWHNSEGRKVKEPKNPVNFDNISLEKTSKPDSFYSVPKNAKVVLKQG